ncbi:MAG: cation diffusion facilitator family transporter [Halioglobus sp.]
MPTKQQKALADPVQSARLLRLATVSSVTTATLLIAAKLGAYVMTGSVSILASLIDSVLDAGASLVNLFAVNYSLSPPDEQHRFGHGKAESVAGLAQATLICGSGIYLIVESIERLVNPPQLQDLGIGLAVMAFAILATLILLAIQHHVIERTGSVAIRADSLHYKTDLFTNTAIILALVLTQWGWSGMDPIFALGVAVYIIYSAWHIGYEAFNDLLDKELPDERRQEILDLINEHPEVEGAHDLRTRLSGRTVYIQVHIELEDHMPLIQSHKISDEVEEALLKRFPTADIVIHQDPVGIVEQRIDDVVSPT